MLLKRTILGHGFSTPEEAVAPLAEVLESRKDIVGVVTLPISIFACFAPAYGRWSGRFRYQARVSVQKEEGRSVVILELERQTLSEALHTVLVFAFWMLMTGLGDHRYLGLGIVLAICNTVVRSFFLISGANRVTEAFASAYAAAEKKQPNQPPQTTTGSFAPSRV